MKYQVWVKAHDPKTLAVIAEVLVFEHENRLEAEKVAETSIAALAKLFGTFVLNQEPIFRTETRIPGWGAVLPRQPGDNGDRVAPRDPGVGLPYGGVCAGGAGGGAGGAGGGAGGAGGGAGGAGGGGAGGAGGAGSSQRCQCPDSKAAVISGRCSCCGRPV